MMVFEFTELSWYTVLAAGFVAIVAVGLLKRLYRRRNYNLPPGPRGLPLLGYLRQIDHVTLEDHRDRYGDVSYINILGIDIVVLNSAKVVIDAFNGPETAEVFGGRLQSFFQQHFNYDDVLFQSLNVKHWKPMRQLLHASLKQYGEGILALEKVVCEELEVLIETLNKKVGRSFDIAEQISSSLINILCILLIGERFDYGHWKLNVISDSIRAQSQILHPFTDLMLETIPLLRFFPVGLGPLIKRAYEKQQRSLAFLYRDFKHFGSNELDAHSGIVFEVMREQRNKQWLTDTKIEGLLQDIIGAGFATTDATLRLFFLLMLQYPNIQERLQMEIDDIIGHNRRPHLNNREDMPYTMATIFELSRYGSIVALSVPHTCLAETTFYGYTIPRNCVILPNLFRIHHDPEVWKDPWVFDPTRFLDDSGALLPKSHPLRQNFMPFGVGKRLCMGEKFAKTRLFLFITYLLQEFSVKRVGELPSCDPRTFTNAIVLLIPCYTMTIERRNN